MIDKNALRSIEKLHEMKAAGILSEKEFEAAKLKLLSEDRPARSGLVSSVVPAEWPREADYVAWMLLPLRCYAQFRGRSSRKEFWLFVLGINVVAGALTIVWTADSDVFGRTGPIGNLAFATLIICLLGVLVPYLAAQARRFHDQGKSGWFTLINLVPYVGALIVLGFMLVPGTPGENEFGQDPAS